MTTPESTDELMKRAGDYAAKEVSGIEDEKSRAMWKGPLVLAYAEGFRAALKEITPASHKPIPHHAKNWTRLAGEEDVNTPAPPASRSLEERAIRYTQEFRGETPEWERISREWISEVAYRDGVTDGLKQGEEEGRALQNTINEYEMRDPLLRAENAALTTRMEAAEKKLALAPSETLIRYAATLRAGIPELSEHLRGFMGQMADAIERAGMETREALRPLKEEAK